MNKFKVIMFYALKASGIIYYLREKVHKNKSIILLYHNPKKEVFIKHVEYLKKNYNFIKLSDLVNAIRLKKWNILPKKSIVLTFDDGHRNNFHLKSTLIDNNIVPTFYLCSHIVATKRNFWWKTTEFEKLNTKIKNKMKFRLNMDKYSNVKKIDFQFRKTLSLDEINFISDHFEIGSHTKYHPILTEISDIECKNEIYESKNYLTKILYKNIDHFSYPNGSYGSREIEYVKSAGYSSARTCDIGWNDYNTDVYRLKVIPSPDNASIMNLQTQLTGVIGYLRYAKSGSFNGIQPSIF